MIVRELAAEIGVETREAIALLTAVGVRVLSPDQEIRDKDAQKVRDVLAGRRELPEVKKKPVREKKEKFPLSTILVVAAVVCLALVAGIVARFLNRDIEIVLSEGQCFNDPGTFGVEIKAVSCQGPHDYRAAGIIDLSTRWTEYPGESAIINTAQDECPAYLARHGFTGTFFEFFYPQNESSWSDEDARVIICAMDP